MSNGVAKQNGVSVGELMEQVIAAGDLSKLSPGERAQYVVRVSESIGLNPLTKPFDLITLNGKLTLYATKGATDQLRKLNGITLRIVDERRVEDVWKVVVEATAPDGRTDTDIGVVTMGALKGDALANALMKAVTKGKRRVTLSICGLGLLDESEVETIPETRERRATALEMKPQAIAAEVVNQETGETETLDIIASDIREAREALGWSSADVQQDADREGISLRTRDGLVQMRDRLQGMVTALDQQYEQPPIVDVPMATPDYDRLGE